MGPTTIALAGFALWFILLTFALAGLRFYITATTGKGLNTFAPDGSDTPGIGRRMTRARDNCFELLPAFAAIAAGAHIAGRLDITDPLAMWVLYGRLGQSVTHIISVSLPAVLLRATFFTIQALILLWWSIQLIG
jgi:uncharacterized MAPEG superfamily protein